MSHIIEVYAKDLGVKIGRPHITEHFVPGLPEKYITLHSYDNIPSSEYLYWDIVLNLINPYLKKQGIKVIQIGGFKDKRIKGVDLSFLGCSYKQTNYIVRNSSTHVGCESFSGHVASVYDIPSVVLHFNSYIENSKPIWHIKNKCINISPDFSEIKPSFSTNCSRINEIKPETVAQNILDQLGISIKIRFKTIRIGSRFNSQTVDIVPNFFEPYKELSGHFVNIKSNLHFDEKNIINWCRFCKVNLHTDQELDEKMLKACINLKQIIFYYSKKHELSDLTKFFKKLKKKNVNLVIVVEDEEEISSVRLKYFDFIVATKEPPQTLEDRQKKCKFLSNKKFITNVEAFNSESSANRLDRSNNFVYDEASSKELENLYLYDEE